MNHFLISIVVAIIAALAITGAVATTENNDLWAVLVAGSNGYYNYRHQSDICHAYQIFKNNGVPDSNIIVMMYDDIAENPSNPHKGQIFNTIGGENVYVDVPKDYTRNFVNTTTFLKVLSGEETGVGSGKTVRSGPNSKIFVFYSDHGAPGLVAMPSGPYLYAKDLQATIMKMHSNKRFGEMIFYIEACESGSMFDNLLPDNMNVYGFTASNPYVSSYACDYDSRANAYLNDCWSRNWMLDTKKSDLNTRTFEEQYVTVKEQTKESPACRYGDFKVSNNVLANFMAAKNKATEGMKTPAVSQTRISSRNVYEDFLKRQVHLASNSRSALSAKAELKKYYDQAARADIVYGAFAHALNLNLAEENNDRCYSKTSLNHDCIKEATEAHNAVCGQYTEYSFKYAKYVSKACATHSASKIAEEFNKICSVVRI